ncbi:MAG TPA: pirin family protein [Acidimicrobiia bacterium]|nr:pirin family protein [Acidimicrobiia bacterium]
MNSVLELVPLSMPWIGLDPFIFTVHHVDHYPAGNDVQGPQPGVAGRQIGADFSYRDGWSMYHGRQVPGFPQHPHRGFETVTVVRRGFIDHSDSLGATARFGQGDTQWLTAGGGIQHAEMFPLIDSEGANELELFQIWLNLPPRQKMVPPYFRMLWSEEIPTVLSADGQTSIDIIAGRFENHRAPAPPPDSWAARDSSTLGIWLIRLGAGATWHLPSTHPGVNRMLHFFDGTDVAVDGHRIAPNTGARLRPDLATALTNHGSPAEFLLLQGQPIGAPVFQMGPFVMNSPEEISQAVLDYRQTQFGGWPWPSTEPVHDRGAGRFAIHADGRVEQREGVPIETA